MRGFIGPLRLFKHGTLWERFQRYGGEIWHREHNESLEVLHHWKCYHCCRKSHKTPQVPTIKSVSRCCAWLHRTYNRVNQGNHQWYCGYGKKGEGFQDIDLGEIEELTGNTPEELTEDSFLEMEVSASEPMPNNEEEDIVEAVPENKLTSDSLIFRTWTFLWYGHFN